MLLLFIVGISYNLARGRPPECHCFGQLHSAPAGWPTLVRNALLAAIAGLIVWQGPEQPSAGIVHWLSTVTASQVVSLAGGLLLLVLLIGEGWLLLNLLRQNGRLLRRIEALEAQLGRADAGSLITQPPMGLPVGAPAPAFQLARHAERPADHHAARHALDDEAGGDSYPLDLLNESILRL